MHHTSPFVPVRNIPEEKGEEKEEEEGGGRRKEEEKKMKRKKKRRKRKRRMRSEPGRGTSQPEAQLSLASFWGEQGGPAMDV